MVDGNEEYLENERSVNLKFFEHLVSHMGNYIPHVRALDVACGVGRITKSLLLKKFDIVDAFDKQKKFVAVLRKQQKGTTGMG